jgi:thymidine kinase
MFLEPTIFTPNTRGSIEIICGAMFSGKTEELIRRLNRARFARQKIAIIKPVIDTRYHAQSVVSHNKTAMECIAVADAGTILSVAADADVIGIDEAQFFDMPLVTICNQLANSGKRVIVAGLDMDYTGTPFGPIPALMATAEYVTKLHAICIKCGNLAHYSHRKLVDKELIVLGETDHYEALCRICYLHETQV